MTGFTSNNLEVIVVSRVVAAAVLACVVSIGAAFAEDLKPKASRVAADKFNLTDSAGRTITLAGLKGKVVLLDFWATWCTGCKEEMPWFMEFQKKYGGRGLASVGVALDDEGWKIVRPYVAAHPINYPIAVADSAFAARYGFQNALPVTILIDRAGRIAEVHHGIVSKDRFEADIVRLLGE